jgi:hypothetical protein
MHAQIDIHDADVYGLASHPSRPFFFVSSSRDAALRFWSVADTLVGHIKLQTLLDPDAQFPQRSSLDDEKNFEVTAPLTCFGEASLELSNLLKTSKSDLEKYAAISRFFSPPSGVSELWDLVESIISVKACPPTSSIQHINDVRSVLLAKARALQGVADHVVGHGKKQDRLESAGIIFLRLGMMRDYCETMVALGHWERAVACAPSVSMPYWQELAAKYAVHLQALHQPVSLAYTTATGNVAALLKTQLAQRSFEHALVTAATDAVGAYPSFPDEVPAPASAPVSAVAVAAAASDSKTSRPGTTAAAPAAPAAPAKPAREEVPVSDRVRGVIDAYASALMLSGEPIKAACLYLAIGDAMCCVQRLLQGDEAMLAYAVVRVLRLPNVDAVFRAMAGLAQQFGLWHEALFALQLTRSPVHDVVSLAAQYPDTPKKVDDFYAKASIRSIPQFRQAAEQALAANPPQRLEACRCLVGCREFRRAVEVGLEHLRELSLRPTTEQMEDALLMLHAAPLTKLETPLRNEVLAYSYYAAAQTAMGKGMPSIVSFLVATVRKLVAEGGFAFHIPLPLLRMQEATYFASVDPEYAATILAELNADTLLPPKLKAALPALKRQIDAGATNRFQSNEIFPAALLLPMGSHKQTMVLSIVSNQPITGVRIALDNLTSPGFIDRKEALSLLKVTPLSPSLTGARLQIV